MNKIIKLLLIARALINRLVRPKDSYWLATKSVKPLSRKFGFDRGTPIDRFWIEQFMSQQQKFIKGHVLEIGDRSYTKQFGHQVTKSDILDISQKNKTATLYGDLQNLKKVIPNDTYDCIIVTHVLGLIPEVEEALQELKRILKPGGVLLVTSSCLSPTHDQKSNLWRFTPAGARYLFGKYFLKSKLEITAFGNVLTGQAFWVGLSAEDLNHRELEYNDPQYPCIVCIKVEK